MSVDYYISRYETSSYACYTYHSNIFYVDIDILSQILFPGLLHELHINSSNKNIYQNIQTSPSKYKLPSYINADRLIENLRTIIGSTLIFVVTWLTENSPVLLNLVYNDYETFFISILSYIITNEKNQSVINLAFSLKQDIINISCYLGSYHSYFPNNIIKTQTVIQTLLLFYLYNNLIQ